MSLLFLSSVQAFTPEEWWSDPIQLTDSQFTDVQPRISADGSKIAFLSQVDPVQYEIFVMNSDGSEKQQITFDKKDIGDLVISADGSKIAFSSNRDGDSEIFVINSDGTELQQLTFNAYTDFSPSISGDGSKIVFQSEIWPDWYIYIINSNGSDLKQLPNTRDSSAPSFNDDGTKVSFYSNGNIWIMNSDGSGKRQLTFTSNIMYAPYFSGDGSKITYISTVNSYHQVFVVNSDGTGRKQLTSLTTKVAVPDISGDGSRVTFRSRVNDKEELYVVNSDGSGLQRLTFLQPFVMNRPIISGDGNHIVFDASLTGKSNIFLVSRDIKSPTTQSNYDGQWHTNDFTITLTSNDELSGIATTHYKINDGLTRTLGVDGQPTIISEGKNNTLEYWSIDNAGNEELPHNILTNIKLDKSPPSATITINSNDVYAQSPHVTLNLLASDDSGIAEMHFSNDGVGWSDWEPYSNSKSWTVTEELGVKTVYANFKDNAGLISHTVFSDTITLQASPEEPETPTEPEPKPFGWQDEDSPLPFNLTIETLLVICAIVAVVIVGIVAYKLGKKKNTSKTNSKNLQQLSISDI